MHLHAGQLRIRKPPLAARLSIVAGGIRQRARRSGLTGDSVPPHDRVRAGVLVVLVSWTAMVIAGSSFAKMSEHFDTALPESGGAHHLPDLAYTLIQTVAGVAGLIVMPAAAVSRAGVRAIPARRRLADDPRPCAAGGRLHAPYRRNNRPAVGVTPITSPPTNATAARSRYTLLFLAWAALVVLTLVPWTVLAVAAARKVTFSRSLLAAEAGMAVAVSLAIVAILAATSCWWAVIAERAPTFLSGRNRASPVNARLVATVTLMALAATAATVGAVRIARSPTVLATHPNAVTPENACQRWRPTSSPT